ETGNSLRTRLTGHLSNIRRGVQNRPVSRHFQEHGSYSLKILGLETNINWTNKQRKRAERRWIETLQTYSPYGLNEA
ncbi:hypothetical protein, partial [Aeromonas cavernicola]